MMTCWCFRIWKHWQTGENTDLLLLRPLRTGWQHCGGIREIRPDFIVKLIRFHESLLLQCRRVRMISYLERKYQDKAYRDHQMILEGLKSGDSRLAQQALAEHIETARLDYLRVMKEKNITEDFWGCFAFPLKNTSSSRCLGYF